MIRFGTLKRFWIIWILYWSVYLIQPVQSVCRDIEMAWLIQFLFVAVLSLAYGIFSFVTPARAKADRGNIDGFDAREANNIIRWGLWISLFGLMCLLYDKIFIQGIDYSQGLAQAREQWRSLGEEREGGMSSLFSAIGYLFGGAYFLSLALMVSRLVSLPDSRRLYFLVFGVLLLLANSLATGGRSAILLAAVFVCFGYFSSRRAGVLPLFRSRVVRKIIPLFGGIASAYLLYVFYSRALAIDLDVATYSLEFLDFLGFEPTSWFVRFASSSDFGAGLALINLAVSYLTHSIATTAAIAQYTGEYRDAIFLHLMSLGAKTGLLDVPAEWFLSGRFPSLPGALYLQFGFLGLIGGASCLGALAGLLCAQFARHQGSVTLFFMCAIVESVLLLSPFLFAGDFLFFPFMVFGGAIVIVIAKLLGRRRA